MAPEGNSMFAGATSAGQTVHIQSSPTINIYADAATDKNFIRSAVTQGMQASEQRVYESFRRDGALARVQRR
jgi:hypothetical protein